MALPFPLSKFALPLILAAMACLAQPYATADSRQLLDLDGHAVNPFSNGDAKLLVFVFVRTDCPISNAYAPEIQRLSAQFAARGVTFRLVYPDADESSADIRKHLRDFGYTCDALRDPAHVFTAQAHVTVTPEAALFHPDGTLFYHGRIDDRYVDFGKARPEASRHDLADALTLALAGQRVPPPTDPAVGCFIEDVR